jgi:hypothetical protein
MELSEIELRRAAAVHEAGHAVVAWTLGLKVPQLRIGEDGKGASCIECGAHLPILNRISPFSSTRHRFTATMLR